MEDEIMNGRKSDGQANGTREEDNERLRRTANQTPEDLELKSTARQQFAEQEGKLDQLARLQTEKGTQSRFLLRPFKHWKTNWQQHNWIEKR